MTTLLADQAGRALAVAGSDPARAAALSSALVARARADRDHAAWSIAERALGLAAMHNKDLDAAIRHLRAAIAQARRCGSAHLAASARMTLAFAQSSRGRSRQGLREIETALVDLHGVDQARGQAQRAVILFQLGRLDEALAESGRALPVLRDAGDWTWVWRALSNRALVYGQRLELAAAEADLKEAAALCERLELQSSAAYVQQNLGWVATLAGDVPAALDYLDDAERRLRGLAAQMGEVLADRAQLLLSVHLATEARVAAGDAVAALAREHRLTVLPEARLLLAQAAMLDRDPVLALDQARRAAGEFRRQGRGDWLAVAHLAGLLARSSGQQRPRPRIALREVEQVAEALEAARWWVSATEARVLAGTLAQERGRTAVACEHWKRVGRHRTQGPATVRARAWYATALLRQATGDRRGAASAARAGLRIVDEYRAGMGATDLRAYSAGHRTELVQLGLRLAFESGRAARVLEWAERGRASLLRVGPIRPPDDPVLRTLLAELRAAAAEVDQLCRTGRGTTRALARQVQLEHRVRDQFRRRPGAVEVAEPLPAEQLATGLDGAVLVEFVQRDGQLFAVTLSGRGLRLRRLAAGTAVHDLLDRITFALPRIGRARASVDSRAAAAAVLSDAATRLDDALLRPLSGELADAPLVLVPTGRLQSVPWSILPSCAGRPLVVAPSATAWYQVGTGGTVRPGTAAVVAGPHLRGAEHEAVAVAGIYGTQPLLGTAATADATLQALRGADLVHLAAHGRLWAENPLFSSLALADGPLMVYDLEDLDQAPPMVVLAACDSGRHVVCSGDELLGLAATLLARGTRQLVGSVIPVPDIETAPLMIEFHSQLAKGRTAAESLAQVQRAAAAEGGAALAAAAGFVCVGAGPGPAAAPVIGADTRQLAGASR